MRANQPKQFLYTCLFSILFSACIVSADEGVLDRYLQTWENQEQVLMAQCAMDEHKYNIFAELAERGHASWLEQRQQKLDLDESKARLEAAQQLLSALKSLVDQYKDHSDSTNDLQFGNAFFSDLQMASQDTEAGKLEIEESIELLTQEIATSRKDAQESETATTSFPANDPWLPEYRLRLDLEKKQIVWLESQKNLLQSQLKSMQLKKEEPDNEAPQADSNYVSTTADSDFGSALALQLAAQNKAMKHLLDYETERLESLRQLEVEGYGEPAETKKVADRVEELETLLSQNEDVDQFLKSSGERLKVQRFTKSTDGNSSNHLKRELHEQFVRCESGFQASVASLRKEMLSEVHSRLRKADQQMALLDQSGDSLSQSIATARRKELAHYQWRIEMMDLRQNLANTRLKTLDSALDRFLVLDFNAQDGGAQIQTTQTFENGGWLSALSTSLLTNVLVASPSKSLTVAELEAHNLSASVLKTGLSFSPRLNFNNLDSSFRPVSFASSNSVFTTRRFGRSRRFAGSASSSINFRGRSFYRGFTSRRFQSRFRYSPSYFRGRNFHGRSFGRGSFNRGFYRY